MGNVQKSRGVDYDLNYIWRYFYPISWDKNEGEPKG